MVGILQRMEADIGGTPIFIRTDRLEALDYAAETWLTRYLPTFYYSIFYIGNDTYSYFVVKLYFSSDQVLYSATQSILAVIYLSTHVRSPSKCGIV